MAQSPKNKPSLWNPEKHAARVSSTCCKEIAKPPFAFHHTPMSLGEKILSWESLPAWRKALRDLGKKLVVTNGCFDILHLGHVTYLEAARKQGDALLVAVNGDASVRAIKGPARPINSEQDRAAVLAALASVDAVCVFHEPNALRLLSFVQPDVYVKGGDYTIDTINQEERHLVEGMKNKIVVLDGVPGKSTTALLEKLSRSAPD